MNDEQITVREAARREVREWLGTAYQHQTSLKGVACDCLGLIRGVWREVVGEEPQAIPAYRSDWAETGVEESLLTAARAHLIEIDVADAQPGDVLLFRMAPEAAVKHAAIMSIEGAPRFSHPRMIHAYCARACVESWIGPWWARRLSHAFSFPER